MSSFPPTRPTGSRRAWQAHLPLALLLTISLMVGLAQWTFGSPLPTLWARLFPTGQQVEIVQPPVVPKPVVAQQQERPVVDVAFVLDTTGSMSSLIEGAKRKIWSIASRIADGQPIPDLRVALVGYRDKGDAYVTKRFDFSPDLDVVFQNLQAFRANGGGDSPEHVVRALVEATRDLSWTDEPNALKLLFLVGDAPPHFDYQDGYTLEAALDLAQRRGILINTIRCGSDNRTGQAWTRIASATGGKFVTIDARGGMREVRTPYDEKLAKLNAALAKSTLVYGAEDERAAAEERLDGLARLEGEAAAGRAGYLGKARRLAEKDLVADVAEGKVDVSSMAPEELPEPLKALPGGKRAAFVEELATKQKHLQEEIRALSRKRDEFVEKNVPASAPSFDREVVEMLKEQAASKGIVYER